MTQTNETSTTEAQPEVKVTTPTDVENGQQEAAAVVEGEPANESATPEKTGKEDKEDKEPAKEMKAIVLTGFGGYKGVKIQKKPEPTLQEGEVLIRVRAW